MGLTSLSAAGRTRVMIGMERAIPVLLGLVAALAVLSTVVWPIGYDTGIFSWVGGVWGRGGVPYVDAWDPKGPATFLPFALLEVTSGQTVLAIRIMDLVFLGCGCFSVFSIVRRLRSSSAGLIAASGLALNHVSLGYDQTVQADTWAGWLAAAAIALTIGQERDSPRRFASAGALIGLAAMIKPHFLILLAVPMLAARLRRERLVALGLGALAAPIGFAIWFALRRGLGDLVEAYLTYNLQREHMRHSLLWFVTAVRSLIADSPAAIPVICAACAGVASIAGEHRRVAMLFALWLVLGLLSVWIQSPFHPYYWQLLSPALAVTATIGLSSLWSDSDEREALGVRAARRTVAAALLAAALSWLAPAGVRSFVDTAHAVRRGTAGTTDRYSPDLWRGAKLDAYPREVQSTVAFLTTHAPPGSEVLVWSDPGINQSAGMSTPGRLTTYAALTWSGGSAVLRRRYREEFLSGFIRHLPATVLLDTVALTPNGNDVLNLRRYFPEFLQAIEERYQPTGRVARFMVYGLRGSTDALSPRVP